MPQHLKRARHARPLIYAALTVTFTLGLGPSSSAETADYPDPDPPGLTPTRFAVGLISTDAHEFSLSMTPDQSEFYFSRAIGQYQQKKIMVTRHSGENWTEPEPVFPQLRRQHFEPHVTPDGQRLYFMAENIVEGQRMPNLDLYYAERDGKSWGEPTRLERPFNPNSSMYASVTNQGTIYTTNPKSRGMDIARTFISPNGFGPYENLVEPINSDGAEMYPFIAPDEDYLLYCRFESGRRFVLVSFALANGSWSEPKEIPLGMDAGAPSVSRDGKYLFFTAGRPKGDLYWVDFGIVKGLKGEATR